MIITQTPFRMSFFGGGTDMESFFRENGGAVLSTTFDKYCYVNVRHLPRFFDYSTELSYSKTERVTCIQIVGTYAPPLGFEKDEKELDKINQMISEVHPALLIACFGCPKQEKWIYENISKYDAKVSVCAGATVDFLAGNVNRAPRWMSEHGLEWFYRFLQEPKRMFKRYFVDDVKIVGLIKKYR